MTPQLPPAAGSARWPRLAPALVAGLVQLVLMGAYAARFGGDVSAFVCVGHEFARQWPFEHVGVSMSKEGFDGQYYYAIARAPLGKHDERYVIAPWYRQLRLLYTGSAWVMSGLGDPVLLLWVLPAINVFAVAAIAGLAACLAACHGRSVWWGALAPFLLNAASPGFRNLTDPTATAAVASTPAHRHRGYATQSTAAAATVRASCPDGKLP